MKFDQKRRELYLEKLRQGHGLTSAAQSVGCDPKTVKRYRQAHPTFQAEVDEAEIEALDPVENKLREMALGGNVLCIFYLLGNRSQGRWRDVRRQEPKTEPILDNKTKRRLLEDPQAL